MGAGVTFAGSGGVLELVTPSAPSAVISGLAAGDSITFDYATFGPGDTVSFTSGTGVLSATLGGTAYTLHLDLGRATPGFV